MKRGRIEIRSGEPLVFVEEPNGDFDPPAALRESASQVGATLKAYRDSAHQLLDGKYSELRELAPSHLTEPCDIAIVVCSNGIIVRYDLTGEAAPKVRWGAAEQTLTDLAPALSESFVHFPPDEAPYDPGEAGIQLHLEKVDSESGQVEPVSTVRLFAFANTTAREFLAKSAIKLTVGWQAFEVYPPFEAEHWKPEFAPLWAENDLLAAVARNQLLEARLATIDPNVAARNEFSRTLQHLEQLLSGPEEPAHQYLKQHPELLCPAHIACWSKLSLGRRDTDFVFQQPGNDYLLVEIESPLRQLFRKDGQQREELTHAFNQIIDWRIYIEDNLRVVQEELGLRGISANPESLIVIGRSASLTEEDRRKIITLQNQIPKLRILTYDDLIQNAKAVAENLFGPLDITGDNVTIYYARRGSRVGPIEAAPAGTPTVDLPQPSRPH
jgi:hypothetical protein